jgi:hypothetical protein
MSDRKAKILATLFFICFAVFIVLGVMVKRVWGHPEFMMAFHGPAAVFLALSGRYFSNNLFRKYRASFNDPDVMNTESGYAQQNGSAL